MDLSKLSTLDLEALRDGDLSRVSTEGLTYLKQSASTAPTPAAPKTEEKPSFVSELGRQLGLTARYGIEGVGQVLDIGGAPIAYTLNKAFPAEQSITGLVTGKQPAPRFHAPSTNAKNLADALGLPMPQNATERVVGEGAKLLAGGGGTLGVTQKAAKVPGMVGEAGKFLSQQPTAQLTAATGGGVAGQFARETGQNPYWQVAASLGGTTLGGMTPSAVQSTANKITSIMPGAQRQVDIQISNILAESGVDYAKLPNTLKESLRVDVSKAMNANGVLNPDAVRRLADIRRVDGVPTVGMLTLDPVQLTREKNVAKMAANMGDEGMHSLPRLENQNNNALINFANRTAGGEADLFTAGQRTIGAIKARDEAARTVENELYKKAQNSAGRDVELSRSEFTNAAFDNLARSNKGAFLPGEIETMINQISTGEVSKFGKTFPVPFDVNSIDSLKTTLGAASRATHDGNAKAAIKAVRDALENTPVSPIRQQLGNGLVDQATATGMQQFDTLPQKALDAFDKARKFARARRTWQESSRGVNAAVDDAQPDKFIEQFFIKGAVEDASGIARELRRNESALNVTKQAIVNHLKEKALGGAKDEVGNFSQKSYNDALKMIGDRKLSLVFDKNELEDLKALGRAASYMQFQPRGSAVNNSNSGALVMGRAGDLMDGFFRALPLGTGLADMSKGARIFLTTRQMKDVPKGLLMDQPKRSDVFARGLLPISVYSGGLLGAPIGD